MIHLKSGSRRVLVVLVVCIVFILPLMTLAIRSFQSNAGFSYENYALLLSQSRTHQAIVNTLLVALISSLIATAGGVLVAVLVAYTNIPGKRWIELCVLSPMVVPSYVIALAYTTLFANRGLINQALVHWGLQRINVYSFQSIILVIALCNIPIVYMQCIDALRKVPLEAEWASLSSGHGRLKTLVSINLAQIWPTIQGALLLSFLAALDNFSVPALLGITSNIPMLSTYIYEKAIGFGPSAFQQAAALAMILSSLVMVVLFLQFLVSRKKFYTKSVLAVSEVRMKFSKRGKWMMLFVLVPVFFGIYLLPILTMVMASFSRTFGMVASLSEFSLKNYEFVLTSITTRSAFFNSLWFALISVAVCLVFASMFAYWRVRRPQDKELGVVEKFIAVPYALPGIVLALAMIFFWSIVPGVYGSTLILLIAYVTRYMILQIKGSTSAFRGLHPELEEAGISAGRNRFSQWIRIIIPLTLKPIMASSAIIFISVFTEVTLSSLLAAANSKTVGLSIFSLQQAGNYNQSYAFSALIILFILFIYSVFLIIRKISVHRRKQHDINP